MTPSKSRDLRLLQHPGVPGAKGRERQADFLHVGGPDGAVAEIPELRHIVVRSTTA
jgi:hypothetical protein